MKKINFSSSKVKRIFSGKGFYIALCFSLIAVVAAGFVAYNQTLDKIGKTPPISIPETSSTPSWDFENANASQTSVPKEDVEDTKTEPQLMVMPLNGDIINPFSNGLPVKSTTTGIWQTHNGVDIKGDLGAQVKSMSNGTVKKIEEDALLGSCITIDHGNGIVARYCNLNKTLTVKEGDSVSAGTVLGAVGDTAVSELMDPSHLHFEVMKNDKFIDPIDLINPGK